MTVMTAPGRLAPMPPAEALRTALATAYDTMQARELRDLICRWLVSKGLMVHAVADWDADLEEYRVDPQSEDALNLAARIAHDDAGHIGTLPMCGELCRALAEAGAV